MVPNFFCTATAAPGLIDELWAFAKSSYLDSPLPSLFKERLFVYLSRFCAVRYCVVRHVGFLIGEGHPAGDARALPETIEQIMALLTRPVPGARALESALARLEALDDQVNIPGPRTELESDLFDALTIIFLEPRASERARNAVRYAFGEEKFEVLTAYLAFIRTAHYWTETHPELAYEPDIAAVMQRHPCLTVLLLDQTEAKRVAEGGALRQALAELTQTKQALSQNERTLAERNTQLALAARAALVGSYVYDVKRDITQISQGYATIHGLPEGTTETTISEWRVRVHPEDLARAEGLREQAFADRRNEDNAEYRIVLSNGEVRWIERRGSISYGADGRPERVVGVNIDITERKTAELALAERDDQLALAGKAARVGSFAIDVGTGMVQISPGYASVHGLAEGTEEFPRDEWRARVHPDDLGRIEALRSQAIAEQCREHNTEYRIVGPDGKTRWIEGRALFSYNRNGHPTRIVGVDIDITERKRTEASVEESEARYRALYDDNPSMYFTVDSSGTVLSVNEFGARQLGYTAAELVGQSVLKVIHHEDHEAARQHLASCTQTNQTVSTTELRKVSRNGSIIWVREVARAVREPGQQRIVILIVCEEITERKRVEEQQRTLVAELDHRVKNVLATVQAVAAHTMETSSSMPHFVAALDGRIRSMGSTHELLSHRQWEGIPLAELVERQLAPYTTGSNIEIAGPEVMLSADAGQTMAMALHELATNAAKYGALSTPRGRISVRWRLASNGRGPATLKFDWHEEGGPVVAVPVKAGYGTSVVRDLIPYELGGTIDHVLAPEGVRCQMEISLAQLCVGSLQTMDLHRHSSLDSTD